MLLLGVLLSLFICVSCLWIGAKRFHAGAALLDHGIWTTGKVSSFHPLRSAFDLDVDYSVSSKQFRVRMNVGHEWRKLLDIESKVPLRYLPENPSVSAIDTERLRGIGLNLHVSGIPIGLFFGGVSILIGRF